MSPHAKLLAATMIALSLGACAELAVWMPESPPGPSGPLPGGDRPGTRASDWIPPPIFGDWWYTNPVTMRATPKPKEGDPCDVVERVDYRTPVMYLPVPVPGAAHGSPGYDDPNGWYAWYARCYAEALDRAGAPIAVLIRERNCPFPFNTNGRPTSPQQVPRMLDALPKLDYLLMDLEPFGEATHEDVVRNIEEIVRLVRSHPNPRINRAFIGNYNDYPGASDDSVIWPDRRDRTRLARHDGWDRDGFYRDNLNVAMPAVYPHRTHSGHTNERTQRGETAPNPRSAIFWAPLERFSGAARALPDGHLLVPWVSNYGSQESQEEDYDAPAPPREDLEAIIQHLRLRGAHSFMVWTSDKEKTNHPTIDYRAYRTLAIESWARLNPLFEAGGEAKFLNLATAKQSGVQWSGAIVGGRAWVLVSNLGESESVRVDLPAIPGLPAQTPPVPKGAHRLFRWEVTGP